MGALIEMQIALVELITNFELPLCFALQEKPETTFAMETNSGAYARA